MKESETTKVEGTTDINLHREGTPAAWILVVDDDHDLRKLCIDVLVDSGYEVTAVADGAAGWEELQTNRYDLVVTDNSMPKMTGVEMIERMRGACLSLPVIMATGCLPTQVFARKPWLQPDATLDRPFSNEDLLRTVKKVLRTDRAKDFLLAHNLHVSETAYEAGCHL